MTGVNLREECPGYSRRTRSVQNRTSPTTAAQQPRPNHLVSSSCLQHSPKAHRLRGPISRLILTRQITYNTRPCEGRVDRGAPPILGRLSLIVVVLALGNPDGSHFHRRSGELHSADALATHVHGNLTGTLCYVEEVAAMVAHPTGGQSAGETSRWGDVGGEFAAGVVLEGPAGAVLGLLVLRIRTGPVFLDGDGNQHDDDNQAHSCTNTNACLLSSSEKAKDAGIIRLQRVDGPGSIGIRCR